MSKRNMEYWLFEEIENNKFYKLHKFLFEEPFNELSNDAKILYSLIKDRMSLSYENDWYDKNGKVYCYFVNEKMCEKLNVSDRTATKYKNELIDSGLLVEKRQYSKPTRYYLKKPSTNVENKASDNNRKNYDYRIVNSTTIESKKLRTNKTDVSKTDKNKTDFLHSNSKNVTTMDDEYFYFENIGKYDRVNKVNKLLGTNRSKITPENYRLAYEVLHDDAIHDKLFTIEELIETYFDVYKPNKPSVEHFVKYI
jgi:hypothetical protein